MLFVLALKNSRLLGIVLHLILAIFVGNGECVLNKSLWIKASAKCKCVGFGYGLGGTELQEIHAGSS